MDQLNSRDLLPVQVKRSMRARCYICSSLINDQWPNPKLTPGVYTYPEMMTDRRFWRNEFWLRYYRMSE